MRLLRYEDKIYELIFVNTDSALSEEDMVDICISAAEMRNKRIRKKDIGGKKFEALIETLL